MDLLEMLKHRRSVRDYTGEAIPKEHLDRILAAGLLSPSGRSRKPWELVVVQDRDTLKELVKCREGASNIGHYSKKDDNRGVRTCQNSEGILLRENGPYTQKTEKTDLMNLHGQNRSEKAVRNVLFAEGTKAGRHLLFIRMAPMVYGASGCSLICIRQSVPVGFIAKENLFMNRLLVQGVMKCW